MHIKTKSKVSTIMFQKTFVKIKCENVGKMIIVIQSNRYRPIYVKRKQHIYSDVYLLKYINE